jgi:hypothetical protein
MRAFIGFCRSALTNASVVFAVLLGGLFLFAFTDYIFTARVSRSFVFPDMDGKGSSVEYRFLPRTRGLENQIEQYVAEALLGPVSVDSSSLFIKGTRVLSVLARDGVAYIDLSEDAALSAQTGTSATFLRDSIAELVAGIGRNFPSLKRVSVFIGGYEPYAFANSVLPGSKSDAK